MKQNDSTLSIITLTKNRAALLSENLASLDGQLEPRDEIIIIDNGSTDETREVIRRFSGMLRIRTFYNVQGTYSRLYNEGIRHAKGDIVVFLDDDCTAGKHFTARIRQAHRRFPGTVLQGNSRSVPRGNIYADIMGDHYVQFIRSNTLTYPFLRVLDNKNASLPRQLIRSVGGFDESLECGSEDIELGIRLRAHGIQIRFVPGILANHHERTTFGTFIAQHIRFARCEGHLDRLLPAHERMGVVRSAKIAGQLKSAVQREFRYIRTGQVRYAVLLPVLYILLACIRIWGYATSR